jgi:hypothetical protein
MSNSNPFNSFKLFNLIQLDITYNKCLKNKYFLEKIYAQRIGYKQKVFKV